MRKFWKSRASAPAKEIARTDTGKEIANAPDSDIYRTLRTGNAGMHPRDLHAARRIANDAAVLGTSITRTSKSVYIDAAAMGAPRESLLMRAFRIR